MNETILLACQAAAIGFLGGWMLTGVKDNWLRPRLNAEIVGIVLRMDRLAELYPEQYAEVRHRRIVSPRVHRAVFALIVAWESLAALACLAGCVALIAAAAGGLDAGTARAFALIGATLFASVWAGMLTFGNHWIYWYAHEWGQNAHFQLLLWGLATMIFLAQGG